MLYFSGCRAMAVTSSPRRRASATIRVPTFPVAPMIAIFIIPQSTPSYARRDRRAFPDPFKYACRYPRTFADKFRHSYLTMCVVGLQGKGLLDLCLNHGSSRGLVSCSRISQPFLLQLLHHLAKPLSRTRFAQKFICTEFGRLRMIILTGGR